MNVKSLIPTPLKTVYHRLNWFRKNYNQISKQTRLRSRHYHGPITYDTDGLTTSNNCDFVNEPKFAKAYEAAAATNPWKDFTLQWRTYIVCWFADHVKGLEGDFVECGVNTGAYSRAVIDYVNFSSLNKRFYLLDTYEGLVPSQISAEEKRVGIDEYLHVYRNVFEEVKKTFAGFNVEIIKGMVPDTLPLCKTNSICYLSIDMNVVEPEIAAANYFWDKIVSGGVIILDDYGFPQHINQKLAFDEFARKKNTSILSLPTGQGIIIKK
jgi:O-methyltransferase